MTSRVDIKTVFLGSYSTGKTSLVQRYLQGSWQENTSATVSYLVSAFAVVVFSWVLGFRRKPSVTLFTVCL